MESIHELREAKPAHPVAPYVGGKRNLATRVIERIKAVPHQTYAEGFVGMGGVFLRRPFQARGEVINDISADVVTLFRVLQWHYQALMDVLKWQVTSREQFERLKAANPDSLTDMHRAARFLYLQRTCFGGKVEGQNFGVSLGRGARFDVTKLGSLLEAVHERLAGVVIERLPYADFLARYDAPGTLFYLDPPYWGSEGYYGPVFEREDFARLAGALGRIKGRFIMSINDRPEIREMFRAFAIEGVETRYSLSEKTSGRDRVGELLISN